MPTTAKELATVTARLRTVYKSRTQMEEADIVVDAIEYSESDGESAIRLDDIRRTIGDLVNTDEIKKSTRKDNLADRIENHMTSVAPTVALLFAALHLVLATDRQKHYRAYSRLNNGSASRYESGVRQYIEMTNESIDEYMAVTGATPVGAA